MRKYFFNPVSNSFIGMFILTISVFSCKKDDNGIETIPPRDRTEQQAADQDSLTNYLNNHYYDASLLSGGNTIENLVFNSIEDEDYDSTNSNHIILKGAVVAHNVPFEEANYTYYTLTLNEGGGENPNFTDDILATYEGSLVNGGDVFDGAITPVSFDLTSLIQGWKSVFPLFKSAEDVTSNSDGTVTYTNFGFGAMFLPSGLAYFSGSQAGIPVYSNLIFKFALFDAQENDHDNDGIASHLEDVNGDGFLEDDTDEDTFPNYVDTDDDGDGVATFNELKAITYELEIGEDPILELGEFIFSDEEVGGKRIVKTYKTDSDQNKIPDYLEESIDINYNEE